MLSQNEKLLSAAEEQLSDLADEAKSIIDLANDEKRERTKDEDGEVASIHSRMEGLRDDITHFKSQIEVDKNVLESARGIQVEEPETVKVKPGQVKSVGEQFVESDGYQQILAKIKGGNAGQFSSGPVEVKSGSLLEGGQGAGLIPVPQVIPGRVDTLFERLTVADLIAPGSTNTNSLRYIVEGTATSGADSVDEGAAKPASDLALSTTDEPVQKIATTLTVSDEMLEDAAAVQSYINGRLSLFVRQQEENQLLNGDGTPPDLSGFFDRSINQYPAGTVDDNAVALFKAMNGTRGSSFVEPEAIIMNPANWQTTRLLTDLNGQYFGGGPFTAAYGGPQGGPVSAQYPGGNSLWEKPVIVTSAVGAGTALLGAFRTAAQLFRRGGVTVEATNSHSDYFTKNLVAIRAEERLALAVYRPSAFTFVTGLD